MQRNLLKSNIHVDSLGTMWKAGVTTGMKNNKKLLWDFKIQTVNKIEHNKPDIVVLDKIEQKSLIIDVACPFDIRVNYKRKRKFRTTKT